MSDILYPLRRLHGILYEKHLEKVTAAEIQNRIQSSERNTVLFIFTPTHGNLGDHAIAAATMEMMHELEAEYIEITTKELGILKKYRKLSVMNQHPILINGGGNIGTLWPRLEDLFRAIIVHNPDSKILCLPNTAFFEESKQGRHEREKSMRVYRKHQMLRICARERISYELLKELHGNVVLIPDMVLYFNKCEPTQQRSGCLLCLREDCERTRSAEEDEEIRNQAQQIFGDKVTKTDMNIRKQVMSKDREKELEKKYKEFRNTELVITDRLHGMIFAAITGTPCIVINSKSPKIRGCYDWLKHLGYIQLVESVNQIADVYQKMPKQNNYYDNHSLWPYYDKLKTYILELISCDET